MDRRRRSGFTLVELLVVIAIIGILVSLLLPAVQSAREAARRSSCLNNMRQLGLGVHLYIDQNNHFPPGYYFDDTREEAYGWAVTILPFIEQQSLFDGLDPIRRPLKELLAQRRDIPLLQTPLSIYRCPSDDYPDLLPGTPENDLYPGHPRHFRGNHAPSDFEPATANYIGNRGFNDRHGDNSTREGTLFNDSYLTLADIEDGTSNTFLIGERNGFCKAATWIGSRNPPGSGMWGAWLTLGRVSIKLNHARTGDHDTCTEGFSSNHQGGAYFILCDNSVRWVSESIDYNNGGLTVAQTRQAPPLPYKPALLGTYQRLGMRDDKMPIGASD